MPNSIIRLAKQSYPEYLNLSDDELTLRYAKEFPEYLKNPEFKSDYDRLTNKPAPVAAPRPQAGAVESFGRRLAGEYQGLGGSLWKGTEFLARLAGADSIAQEAKEIREQAKAYADMQAAKSAKTGLAGFAGMVGGALPSLLPVIATAGAGLPAAVAASGLTGGLSTLGTAEDAYKARYLREGMSEEEASSKARTSALLPATLSGITTAVVTRAFGATGVEAISGLRSTATAAATAEARQLALAEARQILTQRFVPAVATGAVKESAEEFVDQLGQSVIERMSYNPELTLAQAIENSVMAGAVGGVLGGGVTAAMRPHTVSQAEGVVRYDVADKAATAIIEEQRQEQIRAKLRRESEESGAIPEDVEAFWREESQARGDEEAEERRAIKQQRQEANAQTANEQAASERGELTPAQLEEIHVDLSGQSRTQQQVVADNEATGQATKGRAVDSGAVEAASKRLAMAAGVPTEAEKPVPLLESVFGITEPTQPKPLASSTGSELSPTQFEVEVEKAMHAYKALKGATSTPTIVQLDSFIKQFQPNVTQEAIRRLSPQGRAEYGGPRPKPDKDALPKIDEGVLPKPEPEFPVSKDIVQASPAPQIRVDVPQLLTQQEETGFRTNAPGVEVLPEANRPVTTKLTSRGTWAGTQAEAPLEPVTQEKAPVQPLSKGKKLFANERAELAHLQDLINRGKAIDADLATKYYHHVKIPKGYGRIRHAPPEATTTTAPATTPADITPEEAARIKHGAIRYSLNAIMKALGVTKMPPNIKVIWDENGEFAGQFNKDTGEIIINVAKTNDPEATLMEEGLHAVWDDKEIQKAWNDIKATVTEGDMAEQAARHSVMGTENVDIIAEEAAIAKVVNSKDGLVARLMNAIRRALRKVFGVHVPLRTMGEVRKAAIKRIIAGVQSGGQSAAVDTESGNFRFSPPTVHFQSPASVVSIKNNKALLNPVELTNGRVRVVSLAQALDARAIKENYYLAPNDYSPEALDQISTAMADEISAMLQKDGSGVGWYDIKTRSAMELMSRVYPELKTNKESRLRFMVMLAAISQGNTVDTNFEFADKAYAYYRRTKALPKFKFPGKSNRAIKSNIAKAFRLIDKEGAAKVAKRMASRNTAMEWRRLGYKVTGELGDTVVTGAMAMMGPKIGSFFGNLNGDFTSLTADLWFSRTWNRYTGNMEVKLKGDVFSEVRALLRTLHGDKHLHGRTLKQLLEKDNETAAWVEAVAEIYAEGEYKVKTELNIKANTAAKKLAGLTKDTPRNGRERQAMRLAMQQAVDKLAAAGFPKLTIADAQAILWFNEKDLFKLYKAVNEKAEKSDYEIAAQKVVTKYKLDATVAPEFAREVSLQRAGSDGGAVQGGNRTGIIQPRPHAVTDGGGVGQGVGNLVGVRHSPPSGSVTPPNVRNSPPFNGALGGTVNGVGILSWADKLKTEVWANYHPLTVLQQQLARTIGGYTIVTRLASAFENLAGVAGIAKKNSIEFRLEMEPLISGMEEDFNEYLFWQYAEQRTRHIEVANVEVARLKALLANPNLSNADRRSIRLDIDEQEKIAKKYRFGRYTYNDSVRKLGLIRTKLTNGGNIGRADAAVTAYGNHTTKALTAQLNSGYISQAMFNSYKQQNPIFYPMIQTGLAEGSTDYSISRGIVGIDNPDFKIEKPLDAADIYIYRSYAKAESNKAKLYLYHLARLANNPALARIIPVGGPSKYATEAAITLRLNGQDVSVVCHPAVVDCVALSTRASFGVLEDLMAKGSSLLRFGATTASAAFQIKNFLLSDFPTLALMSKAGVTNPANAIDFVFKVVTSFSHAFRANILQNYSPEYLAFMESGAMGTSLHSAIDRMSGRGGQPTRSVGLVDHLVDYLGAISQTIEQTPKIAGFRILLKRAGINALSQLSPAEQVALVSEVRNYCGSPDFARVGSAVKQMRAELLFVFLRAGIAGQSSALERLTGNLSDMSTQGERSASAVAQVRAGFLVGLAAYAAYALNHMTDELREDYERVPDVAKGDAFYIPTDEFDTTASGEKVRRYITIPKRGFVKVIANPIEAYMGYTKSKSPAAFSEMLVKIGEELMPLDIKGKNAEERIMGVASSVNPIVRVPVEYATGFTFYSRSRTVPRRLESASVDRQYTERTNENVKSIATLIGVSPLKLEQVMTSMTGGMSRSAFPRKDVEGNEGSPASVPLVRNFISPPYREPVDGEMIDRLFQEAADASTDRKRLATQFVKSRAGMDEGTIYTQAKEQLGVKNRDVVEKVRELLLAQRSGVTDAESRIIQLPPKQRAQLIMHQLARTSPQDRARRIQSLVRTRVLTRETAYFMRAAGFQFEGQ